MHVVEQGLFRLVDTGRRVVAGFHIAEYPRKVGTDLRGEYIGDVTRQFSQRYVAEAAFAV